MAGSQNIGYGGRDVLPTSSGSLSATYGFTVPSKKTKAKSKSSSSKSTSSKRK